MSASDSFYIKNTVKGRLPSLPFAAMKEAVLGNEYELGLIFVGRKAIAKLNKEHRGKDTPTDILSFPLSDRSGEIFINLDEAKKEAKKFDRPFDNFIAFLFIHGLVHLKGFTHGSKMEREERKFRDCFGI